jgi:putative transposase
MPRGLQRFQQSRQSHFLTFSCYRRQPNFSCPDIYDLFVQCLDMRRRFSMCIYGYVIMPEHVHLLVNEPEPVTLAEAIHYLKLSFAKRLRSRTVATTLRSFWQKRYYGRNVRDAQEFTVKLRYLHRNPVKRPGERPSGVEVEQLSSLCLARSGNCRDRIGVDSA